MGYSILKLANWKEQFIEGSNKYLSGGRHPQSREEEIDDLKRMIGERTLVVIAFNKGLKEGQDGQCRVPQYIAQRFRNSMKLLRISLEYIQKHTPEDNGNIYEHFPFRFV